MASSTSQPKQGAAHTSTGELRRPPPLDTRQSKFQETPQSVRGARGSPTQPQVTVSTAVASQNETRLASTLNVLRDSRAASPVRETHYIQIDYNPVSGRKCLNKYEILRELGRGQHGKVKLAWDPEFKRYVAIKTVNRKDRPRLGRPQGSTTAEKIRREIAILKKCSHPNIVQLFEVLDDESSRKIYLVLEYCSKGEVKWQGPDGKPALSRNAARCTIREVILGLEYLHANNIVHRDIKPANLLVDNFDTVKISDFGVSYTMNGDGGSEWELAKTVGTPAFFAPEMCSVGSTSSGPSSSISSKIDVWALGVTLFCFLHGHLLYDADNEYELFHVIANDPVRLPPAAVDDHDLQLANDLLSKLLDKDPSKRISVVDAKMHPWVLQGMPQDERSKYLQRSTEKPLQVSTQELSDAVRGVSFTGRIRRGLSRFAHSFRTADQVSVPSSSEASPRGGDTSPRSFRRRSKSQPSSVLQPSSSSIQSSSIVSPLTNSQAGSQFNSYASLPPSDQPSNVYTLRGYSATPLASDASDSGEFDVTGIVDRSLMANSLHSSLSSASMSIVSPQLPELDIPVLDEMWASSSSSSDEDTGELTLVLGRGRTRSGGGNAFQYSASREGRGDSDANSDQVEGTLPPMKPNGPT